MAYWWLLLGVLPLTALPLLFPISLLVLLDLSRPLSTLLGCWSVYRGNPSPALCPSVLSESLSLDLASLTAFSVAVREFFVLRWSEFAVWSLDRYQDFFDFVSPQYKLLLTEVLPVFRARYVGYYQKLVDEHLSVLVNETALFTSGLHNPLPKLILDNQISAWKNFALSNNLTIPFDLPPSPFIFTSAPPLPYTQSVPAGFVSVLMLSIMVVCFLAYQYGSTAPTDLTGADDLSIVAGTALGPAALAPLANNINAKLKRERARPYVLPDSLLPLAAQYGLDHNPHGAKYTHPFHYYANEKLRDHAAGFHKGNSVTVMFMKDRLFPSFTASPGSRLVNFILTPADIVRYSRGHAQFPVLETVGLHIDFALHHLPFSFFSAVMASNPEIVITATGAFPIEARFREPSVHPEYTLLYGRDRFTYLPENLVGDFYEHTYESLEWMTTKSISNGSQVFGVSRVASVSACELYVMSACTISEQYRPYDLANCVLIPLWYLPLTSRATRLLPLTLANSLDAFSDRWGTGVYTDYSTKAGQSTVLDATKYTRGQMRLASHFAWLFGNRFEFFDSPSLLFRIIGGVYWVMDIISLGSFHSQLFNKDKTFVQLETRDVFARPYIPSYLRELSMVKLPSYSLTGSGANGPVLRAWLISSFLKTLASKRIFLFLFYHSPMLLRSLISCISTFASLFSVPLSDFTIIVLFVVFFSLPSYIFPLHGWSFLLSDYFPLPEGFTLDHLFAIVAQHPVYRSGNFPADVHQYIVIFLLLTSSMTGVLPGYVTGVLLGLLFVYLCGFAALCAGFLVRFARPIQHNAPFFEVRALFPYMNLDLVPASLICNMRSGQIHDLQPPPPPVNPILPLPGNAIPPLAPNLPPMPLPVLPALAQGRPYAPAFPANIPAGSANHPLRAYFYRPNVVDAPGLVAQLAALPPPIIPYQPSMSCFYNSVGTALGVDGNAIRHAYLASLPTGQIMNYHLYGFVLDNDIRSASAFFGFGIRLLDQANAVQYEQPARDNLPVIDLVLTTIRNVRHITLPRRAPLPAHAAVAQLPVLNAQPSLIGAGRGIDWVLRNAAAAIQVVTNPFTPVPNQAASASKYRYGLSNVHSSFGNALFSLMGLPGPSSSGSVFERDFQLPPTAANFAPITWAGPVELSVSDLGLHTLDLNRASALASALRDGPTIWQAQALSPTWHKCQKQFMRMPCSTSVRLVGLFGCSGCGKTTFVRNNPDMYDNYLTYAWFPSAELMQEAIVADMLNGLPDSHYISDFEVFRKTDAECLILDDFGTCLPGTLDWLIAVSPNLKLIILTGDPTQGKAAWPTEGTRVSGLSFEADYVMSLHGQQISYCNITRRLSKAMASMAGLFAHPSCSDDGNLVLVNHFPDQVPVFVASPRFRTTITAGGVYAYTMSCSQGLSLDKDICVDSGGMSQMMTDNIISMVLCRGKRNVLVRYDHQGMAPAGYRFAASEILSAIVAAAAASGSSVLAPHIPETQAIRHAFMRHYARNLPANLFVGGVAEANLLIGATESSLPATSSDVLREVRLHYPQVSLTRAQPAPTTSQRGEPDVDIFVSDPSILPVPPLDREPSQVERVVGDSATYQLKPEIPVTLHHRRSDDATTAISYDKRIHVATAASNAGQIKDTPESDGLRSTFIRLFGPSHTFNEVAYQLCLERVLDSWLSKRTLSAALRYLKDLDVDLPSTHISTFLKGQVLKKLEKANKEASPGQIVSAPPFIRNMIDAAYALYIEDFLLAAAPPRVYLHLRRTPSSLLSWRSSIGRVPAKFTEIDYAAWDSGVDGKFLTFDIWLFRWFGFCAAYIGFYVYCRINSFFFRGVIGLMQLSGDRYTFLLNTLHNLLLTFLIYNISLLVWIMFAGDDVLIFGWLFAVITHLHFKMNPKTKHSTQGHFCGYMITETGIHAHAQVLFLRFMIAIRTRPNDCDYFRSLVDLLVDLPVITHSPYTSTLLPHVQYHLVKLNMVEDARRLSVYGRISPFAVPFQVVLNIFYSFKLFPSRIIDSAPAPKFKFRFGSFIIVISFFLSMFVLFATVLSSIIKNPINLKHSPSPLLTISMSTNVAQTSLAAAAPVALAVGPSAPSSMLLRPQSFDPVLTFTGTVKLTEQHKVARFDFRSMQSFQQRVAVFESVLLHSVFFKAGISPGTTGLVQYGVDGNHANPTEISSCAIYDFFGGGSMGMASQLFELGASSRFGRELKAPVLGNPTPVFHIGVDGLAAGQYVVLHFRVEVEVAGNAPPVTIAYQHIAPDTVHADVERIEQPQDEDAVAQSAT